MADMLAHLLMLAIQQGQNTVAQPHMYVHGVGRVSTYIYTPLSLGIKQCRFVASSIAICTESIA